MIMFALALNQLKEETKEIDGSKVIDMSLSDITHTPFAETEDGRTFRLYEEYDTGYAEWQEI